MTDEKELGKALKEEQDEIIIESDLVNKVFKIKATGKAAWGGMYCNIRCSSSSNNCSSNYRWYIYSCKWFSCSTSIGGNNSCIGYRSNGISNYDCSSGRRCGSFKQIKRLWYGKNFRYKSNFTKEKEIE